MNILDENDRAALIEYLSKYATDDLLVRAVEEIKENREFTRGRMISLSRYIGHKPTPAPVPVPVPTSALSESSEPVEQPPGTACSRVGTKTKELILTKCMVPSTLEEINSVLGRTKSKLDDTQSILTRLWTLDLLTYNRGRYVKK